MLEHAQRQRIEMVKGLSGLSCEDKLERRNLFPFFYHMAKSDLTLSYRTPHDDFGFNMSYLFFLSGTANQRKHSKKVRKLRSDGFLPVFYLSHQVGNY